MSLLLYLWLCLLYLLYGKKFYKYVRRIVAVLQGKLYFPEGPRETEKITQPTQQDSKPRIVVENSKLWIRITSHASLVWSEYPWK